MLLAFEGVRGEGGEGEVISYQIKWLKAIAVSPHKEEASRPLLHVCCVYECIYNGTIIL